MMTTYPPASIKLLFNRSLERSTPFGLNNFLGNRGKELTEQEDHQTICDFGQDQGAVGIRPSQSPHQDVKWDDHGFEWHHERGKNENELRY